MPTTPEIARRIMGRNFLGLPESRNKIYHEGEWLFLPKDEEVPFACEVTYMVILYRIIRRQWLLSNSFVRCQDVDLDNDRIIVGGNDDDGLCVTSWVSDDESFVDLGLASARMPEPCP